MAEYRIQPGESAGSLFDWTGNGNNATGTVGTAPTIASITGGLVLSGAGAVSLPAALNAAKTIMVCINYQNHGATYNAAVIGNGNGAASNANGIFVTSNQTSITTLGGSAFKTFTQDVFTGIGCITESMNTTDQIYVNGVQVSYSSTGSSVGLQTVGNYQLGGSAAGSGYANASYMTGNIYSAVFWSSALNAGQVAQAQQYEQSILAARGVFSPTNYGYLYGSGVSAGQSSYGSQFSYTSQVLTAAITITRVDVQSSASVAGCSTAPQWGIFDNGTANGTAIVTLSSGRSADSGPISVTIPAGDTVQLGQTLGAAGCSTYPTDVVETIEYHN